jgi:hypothetical protein
LSHENPNPFPISFSYDHHGDEDLACAGVIVFASILLLLFILHLIVGVL